MAGAVATQKKQKPRKAATTKAVIDPLYRGTAFRDLVEGLRKKTESDARRIMARNRAASLRTDAYVEAQPSAALRESLRRLVGARSWRYVSFAEFTETLGRLAGRVSALIEDGKRPVCFAVDSVRNGIKSSFWVVVLLMLMIRPSASAWANLSLAVDDDGAGGGLYTAFSQLDPSTHIVLTDDATYSGEQLTYFYDSVVEAWRNAHSVDKQKNTKKNPRVTVAVPYMSLQSTALLVRRGVGQRNIEVVETFASLFHRRTLANVLCQDLFLEYESPLVTEYHSLYFDFLGVLPSNSLFLFEHKVADALSIPNRWLKAGPCVPSWVRAAYRVRPERAAELSRLLRKELGWRGVEKDTMHESRILLEGARRVCELLASSRKFRAEYCERVSLAPDADRRDRPAPAFLPLISPEFCDPDYQRFVRSRLAARLGRGGHLLADDMPPCRRPPYKRGSFREAALMLGADSSFRRRRAL
jgi:hypothetical protein